jgi:glyoxylase-like metal-dependent hydrolase (beta-lactamase superfamily II)
MLIKSFPELDNIHAIAVPLPVQQQLITANVYVVGSGPVTLIDTGPKMPGFLDLIRKQLNRAGLDFKDVTRIIATHGHMDHVGLATQIRRAAGHPVEVFIHPGDLRLVSKESFRDNRWSKKADELMTWIGVPVDEISKIKQHFASFSEWYDPVDPVSFLKDGDEFSGKGYHLKVIHTPGHTAGSVCLYESKQKILFSGDCLIKHITPNPFIEVEKFRLQNPEYQSLSAFIDSLERLARLDVRYVYSGHGEYIDDLKHLISGYKAHHRERISLIRQALKRRPRPLYAIIDDVFPFVPEGDLFLAVSEILVHLEVLMNEGRAELVAPGPPAIFAAR